MEKKQLTHLLSLIVRKCPDSLNEVMHALETSPALLQRKLSFWTNVWPTPDCHCGFIHEKFEYLSENGVDEEQFGKILENIENNRCIHAREARRIRLTYIYLIHAAAAVANITVLEHLLKADFVEIPLTAMCRASPLHLAIMLKQTTSIQSILCTNLEVVSRFCGKAILNEYRGNTVNITEKSIVLLCIEANDMETAKAIIQTVPLKAEWIRLALHQTSDELLELISPYITKQSIINVPPYYMPYRLIHFALKTGNDSLATLVIEWIRDYKTSKGTLVYLLILAVIYNRIEILEMLLGPETARIPELFKEAPVVNLANILEHYGCLNVLRKYGLCQASKYSGMSAFSLIIDIVSILQNYRKETFNHLIRNCGRQYSVHQRTDVGDTPLLFSLKYKEGYGAKELLKLGDDVNAVDSHGLCPLVVALDKPLHPYTVFDILYFNPSFDLSVEDTENTSVMEHALDYDHGIRFGYQRPHVPFPLKTPPRNIPSNCPLMACILLDCGYDLRNDKFMRSKQFKVDKFNSGGADTPFKKVIKSRFEDELFKPKSLQERCRDVLRKYFSGHALHRFVSNTELPASIRDFILMDSILNNQPTTGKKKFKRISLPPVV